MTERLASQPEMGFFLWRISRDPASSMDSPGAPNKSYQIWRDTMAHALALSRDNMVADALLMVSYNNLAMIYSPAGPSESSGTVVGAPSKIG